MFGNGIKQTKRAFAVAMTLPRAKKEIAYELSDAVLSHEENGVKNLLKKLQEHFGKNEIDRSFELYCSFEQLRRNGSKVSEYIHEFQSA